MAKCSPLIEPCEHGRFKLACECGYRVHARFASFQAAEKHWAAHARRKMEP